jgi:hypothetical protein
MATPGAVPFYHNPDFKNPADEPQKARLSPWSFDFNAASNYVVAQTVQDLGLEGLQALWVDNSQGPAPITILVGQSRQVITVPPFVAGYFRVMAGNQQVDLSVTCFATKNAAYQNNVVTIYPINILPAELGITPANSPFAQPGTPLADSATGANTPLSVTFAAVAGRRTYISSISLTAAGATAALAVNATLTNIDNNGVAKTLNFSFTYPAGVGVPANPYAAVFSPPLPVLAGQAAVLSLPAGGAGNTQAAIAMTGFLL